MKDEIEEDEDESEDEGDNVEEMKYEPIEFKYDLLLAQIAEHKKLTEDYNMRMKEYQDIIKRTNILKEQGFSSGRKFYKPEPILPEFANVRILSDEEAKEVMKRIPPGLWKERRRNDVSTSWDKFLQLLQFYHTIDDKSCERLLDYSNNPEKYIKSFLIDDEQVPFTSYSDLYKRLKGRHVRRENETKNFILNIYNPQITYIDEVGQFEEKLMRVYSICHDWEEEHVVSYEIFNVDGLKMIFNDHVIDLEKKSFVDKSFFYRKRLRQFMIDVSEDNEYGYWSYLVLKSILGGKEIHLALKEKTTNVLEGFIYERFTPFENDMIIFRGGLNQGNAVRIIKFET